jgi:hypothetical protein
VTVVGWPTLMLLMSDSLNATVIVIELVLTISAKPELLEEEEELELLDPEPVELDAPELPVVDDPEPLDPEPLEPDELAELDPLEPVIRSPGLVVSSETIVPLSGAYSRVSSSAVWALRRLMRALSTEASAEAMLAGEGAVVVVPPELERDDPPVLDDELAVDRDRDCDDCDDPPVSVRDGVVLDGTVTVVVVVVVWVGVVWVVVVGVVLPDASDTSETNWADADSTGVLAVLEPEPEPDPEPDPDEVAVPSSTAVSWSSAAVRFSCA